MWPASQDMCPSARVLALRCQPRPPVCCTHCGCASLQDSPDSGDVIELTPKTFWKIVNAPNKNVLIEFYAPWCVRTDFS